MGSSKSKEIIRGDLTDDQEELIDSIFKQIDIDDSKTIDIEEAAKYWESCFAKINAKELFKSVDFNDDGEISYDEWIDFWRIVKGAGHTDEEIMEELENLRDKQSWVGFSGLPKMN
ncbi:unnamed protein product [Moneuplotes crassus]|uniref:EF-hand domain-containing protein n=1 Tax=Euplotes crassus TaxID=5936 RepID=A0AAD2D8D0_EUPCR|nr:unnamed protein product [Moneuplotes crassus]